LVAVKISGAVAVYDGKWWVVDVPGYGATQCKSVTEAERLARTLVADLESVSLDEVEVELDVEVPHVSDQLRRVKRAQEDAQAAVAAEAAARRALVREPRNRGLSQHDIAAVVGVSRPAVQKFLRDKTPA
jgi:DNA-directed RNA polymerase specialized sigma24 family protein